MKKKLFLTLVLLCGAVAVGQERAAVQMEGPNTHFHPGDPIALQVKLNQPLPEGGYFHIRISPTKADQEVTLQSGNPEDASRTLFVVRGSLPKEAVPGEWHIKVIYLFLQGTSWTSNTIQPNPLKFVVDGKEFAIPTTAQIGIAK